MQQQILQGYLGGSETAAAMNLNPYKSRIELWKEKVGLSPPFEGNANTQWGTEVEPALRQWYANQSELAIWVPSKSLLHAEIEWMRATPDGLALIDAELAADDPSNWRHGFEAKNVSWRVAHRWGEPGSDEVPTEYLIQVHQGMAVAQSLGARIERWDIVPCIGGAPPVIYPIRRDDELIGMMKKAGDEFWHYVQNNEPPPVDHTAAYAEFLNDKYPWTREDFLESNSEMDAIAAILFENKRKMSELEEQTDLLKNKMREYIGSAAGVDTALGRFIYKQQKGGTLWKSVAEALALQHGADLTALADQYRAKGSRPFNQPRKWSAKS